MRQSSAAALIIITLGAMTAVPALFSGKHAGGAATLAIVVLGLAALSLVYRNYLPELGRRRALAITVVLTLIVAAVVAAAVWLGRII